MGTRSVQELPVRILTDDELLGEFHRTFTTAVRPPSSNGNGSSGQTDVRAVRRNAAAMEELLRRGYRSAPPTWARQNTP